MVLGFRALFGHHEFWDTGQRSSGDWTLTEEEAKPIFKSAIDHGLYYLIVLMFMDWVRQKRLLGPY